MLYAKSWTDSWDKQAEAYMTPNVLVMWGGDFSHYAPGTFDTLDILMDGVRLFTDGETKLKDKYEIVYSTISEYFASVREDSRKDNI